MLSAKPWKADAMARLLLSVFVCVSAGSLLGSMLHYSGLGGKPAWKFYLLATGALGFWGATLFQVRKPWPFEGLMRRLSTLLGCFYAGFLLGAWAETVAGPWPKEMSVGQMIIGVLCFQGAALVLVGRFLREHQIGWAEAFGFSNHWLHAVLIGLMIACLFLPVARGLQWASVVVMEHLPRLHLKPEEQQAVQALRAASLWLHRIVLGAVTILLAPVAEEMLFRGLLYPWIKQAGFPRLALWLTALLFAAVHANLMIFLPLLVLALVLTALYERTNNLLAPIAAHSLFNALNFVMLYLQERMSGDGLIPKQMNEFELIHRLTRSLPSNKSVVVGAGDDCAVLDVGLGDRLLLFKTDAVVEGIHYTPGTAPEKIGHKALGRCLSDIAAMAGTPTAALVTVALPRTFDPEFVEAIYAGMSALARRHGVAIVGGETTTNPERTLISVALLGWVPRGKGVLRSGAEPGDAIFVTGELGGSLAGKHLEFEPRLAEAHWLAQRFPPHAMIDVSDGLAGDLRHLLKASRVGAELLAGAIPISREARRAAKAESAAKPPLLAALTDGEDFELLFTVASRQAVPLLDAWRKQFPSVVLSCIGKITAGAVINIRDKEGVRPLTAHGYVHFA